MCDLIPGARAAQRARSSACGRIQDGNIAEDMVIGALCTVLSSQEVGYVVK